MTAIKSKIDTHHNQDNVKTCLLSSFAVVGNYYTDDSIECFLRDYYNEYEDYFLSIGVQYMCPNYKQEQAIHINALGKSGYQALFDLYSFSQQPSFNKCRQIFNAEKVQLILGKIQQGTFTGTDINTFLTDTTKNTIINIFINEYNSNINNDIWDQLKISLHSVTIFCERGKIYVHDTNCPKSNYMLPNNWWNNSRIGDVLIYWDK